MPSLTLSRREGEFIRVGDDVYIELREVRGGSARITIHAPADLEILRDEIDDPDRYEYVDD